MDREDTKTPPLEKAWTVIGIMSGTSLDGLDIARARFEILDNGDWKGEIIEFMCFVFTVELSDRLRGAMQMNAWELQELDRDWSLFAAECVVGMKLEADLLSSHGHTVFHNPEKGITTQIGSGAILAARTGFPTVCDLRSLDVAYGGTGAPLIPIVDRLLFSEYDGCVNLGGFANISISTEALTVAWDTGPCNNMLNMLALQRGLEYDDGGAIAREGLVSEALLEELSSLAYHSLKAPKSLGMEWLHDELIPALMKHNELTMENFMCTSVEYIAKTIAGDLPEGRILFSGGGVKNTYLMERIHKHAKGLKSEIVISDEVMIDAKEAYGFAFLGLLRWLLMDNTLSSVTGAKIPSSGGAIWLP